MNRLVFAIVSLLAVGNLEASTPQSFSDPMEDVVRFLGLEDMTEFTFNGKTPAGTACQLSVTRTQKAIVFSPSHLVYAPRLGVIPKDDKKSLSFVFRPREDIQEDINGGFDSVSLWASRFIDDDYSYIHGQFGMGFRLKLFTSEEGKLVRSEFRKVNFQDLSFELIADEQCDF